MTKQPPKKKSLVKWRDNLPFCGMVGPCGARSERSSVICEKLDVACTPDSHGDLCSFAIREAVERATKSERLLRAMVEHLEKFGALSPMHRQWVADAKAVLGEEE